MPSIYLDPVVRQVFDLLRLDSRTSHIDWYKGRRTLAQMQRLPAGNVFLLISGDVAYTMPGGHEKPMRVGIQILFSHQGGMDQAETLLCEGIETIDAVLLATARQAGSAGLDLGLEYAYPEQGVVWRTLGTPEGATVLAYAEGELSVRVIPTGS